MRWAMFQNAEYVSTDRVLGAGIDPVPGRLRRPGAAGAGVDADQDVVLIFIMIWIRSTLPRVRYDRLMTIGWKVLIPLATANLLVTSAMVVSA